MISAALAILETDEQRNELSEIYERNIKTFYSIAFSKLHNQHDAEDAIQEAFLAVARKPDLLFNIPASKRVSYINVIVRNISYKMWNKKHKIYDNETELDEALNEQLSVEDIVISECMCEQILKFIDTLPETTKSAMYLKMHLGLKNSDIAGVLGISEEAAKKRVARAMQKIKQYMEGLNDE